MLPDSVSASPDPQGSPHNLRTPVVNEEPPPPRPGKKRTRQWDYWTHQEEDNFFIALRQVGKNFEKITIRVQSKKKDQVRHYYYRLIKRMNKLLGPSFLLDAKNSKDANSAMLRWWSLLEKHNCSASKLHLKPRRFKTFITALEHQLLKDQKKAKKKQALQAEPMVKDPGTVRVVSGKSSLPGSEVVKVVAAGDLRPQKPASVRGNSAKPASVRGNSAKPASARGKMEKRTAHNKGKTLQPVRQRRKVSDGNISAAAYRRWEKVASAGVNLVAEAAEQLERAAVAEQLEQAGKVQNHVKPSFTSVARVCTTEDVCQQPVSNGVTAEESSLRVDATALSEAGIQCEGQQRLEGFTTAVRRGSRNEAVKLKLQLFPIDDFTRKSLEQDGLHPYLELTLKSHKAIPSVLQHLAKKWGRSSVASGELRLFPFTTSRDNASACQSWSFKDASVCAGDVYAAIGHPSVFQLKYGWLPCRVLDSSNAELLQQPGYLSQSTDSSEACSQGGLQIDWHNHASHKSAFRPALLPNTPTFQSPLPRVLEASATSNEIDHDVHSGLCAPVGTPSQLESLSQTVKGCYETRPRIQPNKPIEFPCNTIVVSDAKTPVVLRIPGIVDCLVTKDAMMLDKRDASSLDLIKCSNRSSEGLCQSEEAVPLSSVSKGEDSCTGDKKASLSEKASFKSPEGSDQLSSCYWVFGESNDGFVQRFWGVEEETDNCILLPAEMDWADSLTNISVGELLNEVSQVELAALDNLATQAQQNMQSLDSFDAAIAAQHHHISRVENSLVLHSQIPAWDGEDACDAFSFQRLVSQKKETSSSSCARNPTNCEEELKEPNGLAVALADFASLEAWKQSIGEGDFASQELKTHSELQSIQHNSEGLGGKQFDFCWVRQI